MRQSMRWIWSCSTDGRLLATHLPDPVALTTRCHKVANDMADIMKILEQAQQMQGRLQQLQDELQQKTVTGSAGGGMVQVEADGKGTLRKVSIDPGVVDPADVEMLEDLVLVAVSDAQKKAAALAQDEMGKLTGGMGLPFKLPF